MFIFLRQILRLAEAIDVQNLKIILSTEPISIDVHVHLLRKRTVYFYRASCGHVRVFHVVFCKFRHAIHQVPPLISSYCRVTLFVAYTLFLRNEYTEMQQNTG